MPHAHPRPHRPSRMRGVGAAVAVVAALAVGGCSQSSAVASGKTEPAKVEQVPGSDISRLRLSQKAVERLGIQTAPVGARGPRTVMPYSALIYDPRGETWTYTNPEPLLYLRHRVRVERIDGDLAVLTEGPPAGTAVATVGAALLFGTEFKVGK